jgi:glycogen operon protein
MLCARRQMRGVEHEQKRLTLNQLIQQATKSWHGVRLNQPDWGDASHIIALTTELRSEKLLLHLIINAYAQPLDFELPESSTWRRWIDTSLESPQDIVDWRTAPPVGGQQYRSESRSVVALIAESERNRI